MIVDKTPDRNRLEPLSVCPGQSLGEGGILANQLDWDAHLRTYIPFENFLSTPKHDRRDISIFCSPVMMRCRCIFSPLLFSQPPINNAN